MELGRLCVGKEGVWPPDLIKHLVTDTQFVFGALERQTLVAPMLPEVEIQRKILYGAENNEHLPVSSDARK